MTKALGLSPNHPLFTEKDKVKINIYSWEMANNVDGWRNIGRSQTMRSMKKAFQLKSEDLCVFLRVSTTYKTLDR